MVEEFGNIRPNVTGAGGAAAMLRGCPALAQMLERERLLELTTVASVFTIMLLAANYLECGGGTSCGRCDDARRSRALRPQLQHRASWVRDHNRLAETQFEVQQRSRELAQPNAAAKLDPYA